MSRNSVSLPSWAVSLAEKYRGGTLWEFIIHGNIHDLVPYSTGSTTRFLPLKDFLETVIFAQRDSVIFYDQASGISFSTPEQTRSFLDVARAVDMAYGTSFHNNLPRDPGRALFLIERFIRAGLMDRKRKRRVAVIVDFSQMLAPAGRAGGLSKEEASTIITFLKWARDPEFQKADITICLIAENLAELNDELVRSPNTAKLRIPLPGIEERRDYIESELLDAKFDKLSEVRPDVLARLTAGLSRINLLHLVSQAINNGKALSLEYVRKTKKELIEKECYGLLEFIEPKHDLDVVVGHKAAKEWLKDDAALIAKARTDALPMGYLVCGPVGTGKTFLATCFTGAIGIPCVKLLNFRSQWQGVTEGNWEKILTVLKATGPIGVIIDEADAAVGDRSASGDSGTSSRVFARLASTMGDTANRGHILWFLLTCRPDLLPVDLKRQGRAEVHIPLFYPGTAKERHDMYKAMAAKSGTRLAKDAISAEISSVELSGADIEAIVVRAKRRAYLDGRKIVTTHDLKTELDNFLRPVQGKEIELQELAAVAECTNKSFLPARHRKKKRSAVQKRVNELKRQLA